MKNFPSLRFLWIFALFSTFSCATETALERNVALERTIADILAAYNNKDDDAFNHFIHPQTGLTYLYTLEFTPIIELADGLCLSGDCPEDKGYASLPTFIRDEFEHQTLAYALPFQREAFPVYSDQDSDCHAPDKEGVFIGKEQIMSAELARLHKQMRHEYEDPGALTAQINGLNAVKVVVANADSERTTGPEGQPGFYSGTFVFYLSWIEDSWWLIVVKDYSLYWGNCSVW